MKEGEPQLKDPANIFNNTIEEKFPNLKKEIPIKVQNTYKLDKERKSPCYIIIKTLNIQTKQILKPAREVK